MTGGIYDLRGCTSQNIPNASPNIRMMASGSVHGDTSITKLPQKHYPGKKDNPVRTGFLLKSRGNGIDGASHPRVDARSRFLP